jgi:hypothetical protein
MASMGALTDRKRKKSRSHRKYSRFSLSETVDFSGKSD